MNSVILVAEGVQDQEFWYPYYRLQEVGNVIAVSPNGGDLSGKYKIPIKSTVGVSEYVRASRDVSPDILIVPGGWQCPEILRMNQDILKFVRFCYKYKTIIGAICHGPQVLISAQVGVGRTMTAYAGIKDDLINFGANWVDHPVVRDGNLVTAQHYKDNPVFMREILSGF